MRPPAPPPGLPGPTEINWDMYSDSDAVVSCDVVGDMSDEVFRAAATEVRARNPHVPSPYAGVLEEDYNQVNPGALKPCLCLCDAVGNDADGLLDYQDIDRLLRREALAKRKKRKADIAAAASVDVDTASCSAEACHDMPHMATLSKDMSVDEFYLAAFEVRARAPHIPSPYPSMRSAHGPCLCLCDKPRQESGDVPSALYVVIPRELYQLESCAGQYELMTEGANEHSVWCHTRGDRFFYYGMDYFWYIGEQEELDCNFECSDGYIRHDAGLANALNAGAPPDHSDCWEYGPDWTMDARIRVSREPPGDFDARAQPRPNISHDYFGLR